MIDEKPENQDGSHVECLLGRRRSEKVYFRQFITSVNEPFNVRESERSRRWEVELERRSKEKRPVL